MLSRFQLQLSGATTNSENGDTDVWNLLPVFKAMASSGVPLLVHGEVVDDDVDVFDREKLFIQRILVVDSGTVSVAQWSTCGAGTTASSSPRLKSSDGAHHNEGCSNARSNCWPVMSFLVYTGKVEFVMSTPDNVAATITPQHITLNRNALFKV